MADRGNISTGNSGNYSGPKTEALEHLKRIADAAERNADAAEEIKAIFDSLAGAVLEAKFPYGDGVTGDRWSRRRPRGRVS